MFWIDPRHEGLCLFAFGADAGRGRLSSFTFVCDVDVVRPGRQVEPGSGTQRDVFVAGGRFSQ
jgi:hypothetical protein